MVEKLYSKKSFGEPSSLLFIGQRSLDFTPQRTFFRGLREIDLKFKSIWVEIVSVPECIIYEKNNLIKIDFIGHTTVDASSVINNLHITTYQNPYNIVFDPNAIIDCADLSVNDINISFNIKFQESTNSVTTTYEFNLNVNLSKGTTKPKVHFDYDAGRPKIKYKNSVCILGYLRIINDSPYKYSNPLILESIIKFDKAFDNDIITWGDASEVEENAPHYAANAGIRTSDQVIESCLIKAVSDNRFTLRNIVAQNTISIPVYIDLMRIGNPSIDNLPCSFTLDFTNLGNSKNEIKTFDFAVVRDTQCTQMSVFLNGQRIENGQTINLGKLKWIEFVNGQTRRFDGISKFFRLQIQNIAENEGECANAAVAIRNLCVDFEDESGCVIHAIKPAKEQKDELIELLNKPDSTFDIVYLLYHKLISSISNDSAKVKTIIRFEYIEDKDGARGEDSIYMSFVVTASLVVETDPGNEWLCIDFGTSATVAAFGNGSETSNLLDLDRQAEAITNNLPQRMRTPRFEEGTKFLSSNAKFRQGGKLDDGTPYQNQFVWLSPTERQFYSDSFILPYIKSLAGYRTLPSSLDYTGLRYNHTGKSLEFSKNPLSVDEIFNAIYKSLFKDFIIPSISADSKSVNKLILSVPNTYTPRHLDYLHKIITANIPQIRKNYIWFISESDAIASYYITNWHDLNTCRNNKELEQLSNSGKEEYVLAFDMGAGTLDLTYFSIKNNEDETRDVNILAKIGLNKAGNYLDYIIAEALIDTHSDELPRSLLTPDNDPVLLLMAGKLKHFIKQNVKPNLFSKTILTFSELNGEEVQINGNNITLNDIEINLLTVRNHSLISSFIEECTTKLVENLFVINGYQKHQTPIDTVIFTGRSVQFGDGQKKGVRNSLMSSISDWNVRASCQQINIEGDNLKTVVCDGALHFATTYSNEASAVRILNQNIYASYGILYKDIRGVFQYLELLSPKTKAIREPNLDINSTNGVYIYEYDTDKYNAQGSSRNGSFVDLRNSPIAFFVQSYSQDTARDWKNNRRELISVMWDVISVSTVSSAQELIKVPVRIEVNADNEMIFTMGNLTNEPSAPMVININESDSFKQSMWPYM